MTPIKQLEHLGGQVNALLSFVAAAIQSHPDREKFLAIYLRSADLQEAMSLNAAVSEDFLKGQRDTRAGIEKVFKAILEHKKP